MSNSPNSSSNSNHPPTILLLAVAIFGPPSLATLAFAHAVTQNPWLTALLILLYEIIIFIISVVGKLWKRLEDPWIEQIATWVNTQTQAHFSSYYKHYCQYLIYQHRDFDVKGLGTIGTYTLDLERVFVELSIDPKAPHQTSANPLKTLEALNTVGYSIWDYLGSELLTHQHLVIIGAPGSGKTTLLKHTVLTLIRKKKYIQKFKISYKLPFLLFLRDYVDALKNNPMFSLVDAVQMQLSKWEWTVSSSWIETQLRRGNNLILLDGLDEVANRETRLQIADWVQRQIVAYGKNRFIITSRPFGYRSNPLSGVVVLEVCPFTSNHIEQFIHNWYLANEIMSSQRDDPGVCMKAKDGAEDLLHRLRNTPTLFDLAVNPLLLTMIATVHRYRGSLPGTRIALYAEICEVSLGKRQEARGLTVELSPEQKMQVLQPLAYHMMLRGTKVISNTEAKEVIKEPLEPISQQIQPEVFLQLIENTSGLLLEKEQGVYGFAHLTFQEYLAAIYIREFKLENILIAQIEASWWHEVIRLYCAQTDATPIIVACLVGEHPSTSALTLALECQGEALKIQPIVNAQLEALLNQNVEDIDLERRYIVTQAALIKRVRQMVHSREDVYRDTSFITCAEYQIFLDEQREHNIYYQLDHWLSDCFPSGYGQNPILGVRPSDAVYFCKWLTNRERGNWHYRLPQLGDFDGKIEYKGNFDSSITSIGYWAEEGSDFIWVKRVSSVKAEIARKPSITDILDQTFTCILGGSRSFDNSVYTFNRYNPNFSDIADTYIRFLQRPKRSFYPPFDIFSLSRAIELSDAISCVRTLNCSFDYIPLNLDRILMRVHELKRSANYPSLLVQIVAKRVLGLAYDLARNLDFTIDKCLSQVFVDAKAGNLANDLDIILKLTFDYILNLTLDLTNVLNLARTSPEDSSLNLAYSMVVEIDDILTSTLDLTLDFAYIGYSLIAYLASIRELIRSLIYYLNIAKDFTFANDQPFDFTNDLEHIRNYETLMAIRACAAYTIITLKVIASDHTLREQLGSLYLHSEQSNNIENQNLLSASLDIYAHLLLLEKRKQGKSAAYEGILIVKEWKPKV